MDIKVGDTLFGYPVVEVTDTMILIRLPGNIDFSFDRTQFTAGVEETLAEAGDLVHI